MPPVDKGRVNIGVPIDLPFTEVSKIVEAQLKNRSFPEDGSGSVDVKLHCEGAGLATETPLVTALIGCPTCGVNNQIVFSIDGQLHRVDRPGRRLGLPQPSLN